MDLGRREFTATSVSISALLAGCSALGDDEDPADGNGSDEDAGDANGDDPETETETKVDPAEEPEIQEDESMPGEVLLSDEAAFHLEVVQETFSWMGEPSADTCHAHVMLANDSGAELTLDLTARIYDAEGTELSSTTSTGVAGPEPGQEDAVYSLELNNCEATAEYELEVVDLEAEGELEEEDVADDQEDAANETDDAEVEPDDATETEGNETEANETEADTDEVDAGNETDDEADDLGNETADDAGNETADDTGNETADDAEDEDDLESLHVTVQDADGEPIDHATVEAHGAGLFNWGETREADDQGQVEFDLEDGEQTVTAEADGYDSRTDEVDVDGPTEHTMVLEAADDGTNELTVFVQDGDGEPIDHATVVVEGTDRSELQEVDGQGRAAFDLQDGEYDLTAAADGYPTLEENVAVETDLEYTATLSADD